MDLPHPGTPPATAGTADDPLWFKDAVIYQLHVKAFADSNEDGIGDFRGLASRLQYVKELGVDAIWLMPFYPSPMKDDGYDVADYHHVHPDYGTRADFRAFLREAHRSGLRVITELVVNHTSDQHPWFQAARRAPPGSSKRSFYVWSDSPTRYAGTRIIFTDTEKSNWAWDEVAQSYYWHRFFSHQPDLNFDNPHVLRAVRRTMQFWLDMGVDGFRLDAIPYLCERDGTNNENLSETHEVIRGIRSWLDANFQNRVLLAEANQWPEDVREYFGAGDECHMAYHFPLMPRIYMAIAQEDRYPIVEIMHQTPDIPDNAQWAIFLRNHDELTLEMVTSRERDYMYRTYAADPRARINLGIRRRLAPLMENDPDRIKLMNSLLLSMPGSPIIYYGDEIGMGDNIYLGDRNGVRTPMQWSPDRNAGFSRADPQRLYLPPIMDPVYGYQAVNVEAQSRDPSSLLNWMKRMLAVRRTSRAFGRGRLTFLRPGNRRILTYLREIGDDAILCVANLSGSAQPVELDLSRFKGRVPVEMLGRTPFPPIGELPYLLTLPAHGFYWFRLAANADVPAWHEDRFVRDDVPIIVLFEGWSSFFPELVSPTRVRLAQQTRLGLRRDVLPRHMERQRWYAAKGTTPTGATLAPAILWDTGESIHLLAFIALENADPRQRYFLPLSVAWEDREEEKVRALASGTVARVRRQASMGVLADATGDETFCRAMVRAIGEGEDISVQEGHLRFTPTSAYPGIANDMPHPLPVERPQQSSSNTVVTMGERFVLKLYRRLLPGLHPEIEVGRYLTEEAGYANCVPLAGTVEYVDGGGNAYAIAMLQSYVRNQGDGWAHTLAYLDRHFGLEQSTTQPMPADVHAVYVERARMLGQRTAELHLAFARGKSDAFRPEQFTPEEAEHWRAGVGHEATQTLARLAERITTLPVGVRVDAEALLQGAGEIGAMIRNVPLPTGYSIKSRHHGDLHLGQVMLTKNDFVIIDFEGEPGREMDARRSKGTPLRDVAGMLRSFSYAKLTAVLQAGHTAEIRTQLMKAADLWEREARHAFLGTYAPIAEAGGIFNAFDDVAGLLKLCEIEKALYEVRYELDNRPDWLSIPVKGLLALMDTADAGPPGC